MKRLFSILLIMGLVNLFFPLSAPLSLFASQGIPQIELSVSQASPGATIEVTGGRFEPDAVVTFVMFQPEKQIQLGTTIADDHGEFVSALRLPLDLAYGQYEFGATDEQHRMATADLTISCDTSDDDESGQRGEDEPLLAPIPTQTASTGYSTAAPSASTTTSLPTNEVEPPIPISLLFSAALAIVVLVVSVFIISRGSR